MTSPASIRLKALFEAADAGLITLPSDVVELREAIARGVEHLRTAPPPVDIQARYREEIRSAILARKPWSASAAFAKTKAEEAAAAELTFLARQALAAVEEEAVHAVASSAGSIITGTLREAIEAVLGEFQQCLEVCGHELDGNVLLKATPEARAARLQLDELAGR